MAFYFISFVIEESLKTLVAGLTYLVLSIWYSKTQRNEMALLFEYVFIYIHRPYGQFRV